MKARVLYRHLVDANYNGLRNRIVKLKKKPKKKKEKLDY